MYECQPVWSIDCYMYVISTWKSWFCLQRWKGYVTNCFMRMWNSCCKSSSCCTCFCLTWKSVVWRSMFCRIVFSQWFIHQDVRVHGDVHMMWHLLLWRRKMKNCQVIFLHECFSRLIMFLVTRYRKVLEGPCLSKRHMSSLHSEIMTWATCQYWRMMESRSRSGQKIPKTFPTIIDQLMCWRQEAKEMANEFFQMWNLEQWR